MNFYVLDSQLNILDLCEVYISYIWTNRYYEYGDFEIYAAANNKNINLLKRNRILVREGKEYNAMIIEEVQTTTDSENGNTILVKGRCLKSIIARRIIWQQTNVTGNFEQCIKRLLDENVINPSDANRKIPNFVFQTNGNFTGTMSQQFTGDNLYEAVVEICKKFDVGFDIMLDLENKQFIFYLYKGTDRSYNQMINPHVVFSDEFENMLTSTHNESAIDYKNVVRIGGEGEGIARKFATVGDSKGLDRYELYVDSRNTSSNDGAINENEYLAMLTDEANAELASYKVLETYEGEVETGRNYRFNKDYFLGDIVETVNEYGNEASVRVTEVIESEDESGTYTIPTFSNWS